MRLSGGSFSLSQSVSAQSQLKATQSSSRSSISSGAN